MAEMSGEVIVKAGLNIQGTCPLLQNFLDFVWDNLDNPANNPVYMNIPELGPPYLDVMTEFKWSYAKVNSIRMLFIREGNEVAFELPLFPFHPVEIENNHMVINYPIEANRNISAIKISGSPVMDMLLKIQDPAYVAYKMNVLIHQVGAAFMQAQRDREKAFLHRYWDGYANMNIRFGVRSGYDIPWHRDSGEVLFTGGTNEGMMFGTQRHAGFITGAMYTNRPAGLPNTQGGISFMKDGGVFTLFPKGGTCVTFLDPEIFHSVIPVTDGGTAEHKRGFIKRSSVFMEFYTDRPHVEQNAPVQPIFNRPSLPSMFRNAKKTFQFLKQYFDKNFSNGLREHGLNADNIRQSIISAPEAVINRAYAYMPATYPAYVQSIHPGAAPKPLPEFFVFKVRGSNHLNKRQKLLNLYELYTHILSNFNTPTNNNYRNVMGMSNENIAAMRVPRYRPNNGITNHQGFRFNRSFLRGNLNAAGN